MATLAIETRGLTKNFLGFAAVKDLSLSVRRGSIHALIGPNGAGKTTVFNLITKFHLPSSGRILVNGEDVTELGPARIARRGVARSFQISAVFGSLSVRDNLRVALQRRTGTTFRFWCSERRLARLDARAEVLIGQFGLRPFADTRAGELSYGRKRALEIATTLALDPDVLLLDEPMAGLGVDAIAQVSDLIREAARGRTVLMVEHNLSVVADLCDRVTVLQRGRLLAEGAYAEVAANPEVVEAYLGTGDEDA